MKACYMKLNKILDLKKWQTLQDSLALVTKLAIITVDHKGIPITAHSDPRPFCTHIRSEPDLVKYCHKCDARAGLEAVRLNAPYIYLCHCKIVDLAIPITIDDKYIGAIMAEQIRLPENEEHAALEQILVSPATGFFPNEELRRMYEAIPVLPYKEIERVAGMLRDLCYYIVEESMNKNLLLEMYERMLPLKEGAPIPLSDGYSLESIEHLKKELGNAVTNAYVKVPHNDQFPYKNPVLEPAFSYIYRNKGENISQEKMADLCNISASYFSRLFVKETGETFPKFIARQKVEWSKQLLVKTDLPISLISDELGFSDPGYFIKTFKKHESITPAVYRKYYTGLQAKT
ncbi:MAG: PocR ligand-binding domain-containing protein [Treponema sp.]|nr:PocR ligand-binding domain-containing protein [Treponema sp.]